MSFLIGVASFVCFIIGVGLMSHLSNLLIFGRDDKRTKDEMWGMPIAIGVFMALTLGLALLLHWLVF